MPKVQMRLPKSVQAQRTPRSEKAAPLQEETAVAVATPRKTKAKMTIIPAETNGKVRTLKPKPVAAVETQTPAPKKVKTTAQVRPTVAQTPAVATKKPRTPRIRSKVDAHQFLPRVERLATLKTPRAIEYLQNLESRAQEVRKADFSQKVPMSIMEMKALNEAIRILQVKLKLEQEYVASVKAASNGTTKS